MKAFTTTVLAVVFVVLSSASGCREKTSALPLSLATVEQIHSGQLSFEERGSEIFVSVSDPSGDRHIHLLEHPGHSRQEALEILRKKQTELEKAEPSASENGASPRR